MNRAVTVSGKSQRWLWGYRSRRRTSRATTHVRHALRHTYVTRSSCVVRRVAERRPLFRSTVTKRSKENIR